IDLDRDRAGERFDERQGQAERTLERAQSSPRQSILAAILDATPGFVPEYAQHQSGRSWVRADRLEYPQGEAVSDVPLLWDRSQEGLGSASASVRLRVRGNAGPGGGTGDACGRSAVNRSGSDLGSRKRA